MQPELECGTRLVCCLCGFLRKYVVLLVNRLAGIFVHACSLSLKTVTVHVKSTIICVGYMSL